MKYIEPEMEIIEIEFKDVFTQVSTVPGVTEDGVPSVEVPEI